MRLPTSSSCPTLAAGLCLAMLGCAAAHPPPAPTPAPPPRVAPAEEPVPVLQLPTDVRPVSARLELEVDPAAADFSGRIELEVVLDRPRQRLWLNGRGLRVSEAAVEAGNRIIPATWTQVDDLGVARLDLPAPVGPGRATVRLAWRADWSHGEGLFRGQFDADWYAATQLQAVSARRVFPCFDEPAFKHPWSITVVAPAGLTVVSNQPEAETGSTPDGRQRVRFAPTRPLPSELLFVAVGPYQVVAPAPLPPNPLRPRPLQVRAFAPRGRAAEVAYALEAGAELLVALERYFGLPFPYEKLDHVAVPEVDFGGAMENAGAISYAARNLLLDPMAASERQRETIASVVAHEVAHQWFGDLVTPTWWTDIWLNESFATWMATRTLAAWRPAWRTDVQEIRQTGWTMTADGLSTSRAIRQPLTSMARVNDQFDDNSYTKGGAVIAMFERAIGVERFQAGVRRHLAAHADGVATTGEFLAALSAEAGRDVAPAFATFLDQAGVPLVEAALRCEQGAARVTLRQSRWQPRGATRAPAALWQVPVCLRYEVAGRIHERCQDLATAEGSVALPEGCPAWVMPNAGGVGYYQFSLDPASLAALRGRGLPRLSPAEKIALLHALGAASQAGALAPREPLQVAAALARDADPEVVLAAIAPFEEARAGLLEPAGWPALEAAARRLFQPAFDRLGWEPRPGEPEGATRLRAGLAGFLADAARDPAVRREAARRGARLLGMQGGPAQAKAAAPDLAGVALMVAVQERGAPAFDAALAALATAEGERRSQLVMALASAREPALAERARGLWPDPRLRRVDRQRFVWRGLTAPETREATFAALERDLDGVLALLPEWMAHYSPALGNDLCEPGQVARYRALFEPRVAKAPTLRRPFEQALEAQQICLAVRAADGAAVRAALEALGR